MKRYLLTIHTNPVPKTSKRERIEVEKDIQQILFKSCNAYLVSDKITHAYTYFIDRLRMERTVCLFGAHDQTLQKATALILEHEIKSPRFRVMQLLEQLSRVKATGLHCLKLLDASRNSLISRFNLYKNVYNMEILHGKKRIFNYCKILEKIWEFHRRYKHFLSIVITLSRMLEKCNEEYTRSHVQKAELVKMARACDFYTEVQKVTDRIFTCILNHTEICKGDIKALKGFALYYGELAYVSYGAYGYGSQDLLFLFYEVFEKNGQIKSTHRMNQLLSAMDVYVNRQIILNVYAFQKCRKSLVNINSKDGLITPRALLNTNYSKARYIILPFFHKLSGYAMIFMLSLSSIKDINLLAAGLFSSLTDLVKYERVLLLVYLLLKTGMMYASAYFVQINSIIIYSQSLRVKRAISYFIDLLAIVCVLTLSIILRITCNSLQESLSIRTIILFPICMLSLVLVLMDNDLRLPPVFTYHTKKEILLLGLYLFSLGSCTFLRLE
ncbi:hypothetical protein NERG_02155 [Nematocida ausubeli]|uniref:Uncharacterized protein n=1 Tax=Nematocida ausubeli (strain ATCC PRA-371 / ERTm2) TaxID=1913371 RepID=H8ZEY6_NEMA1|nr:hypothetical protein NERG_02155 [Nematocida ausubeli]